MGYPTANPSKGGFSPEEEQNFKVRKPYTITKQRERWTDEEHKKFLEALKLHGRAWRRIQEHIGTKTAVQIRSHAQKFFSKVVRDSTCSDAETLKPIEIPPPRPKKKPTHPYPRKLGSVPKKRLMHLENSERSPSPTESVMDQEHGSPTSVLSAVGSYMSGSPQSSSQVRCVQSDSDTEGLDTDVPENPEPDNACQSPSPSAIGENGSLLIMTEKHSAMELDNDCSSEATPNIEAPLPSLKLFGRTVVVNDSEKASPSNKSLPSFNGNLSEVDASAQTQIATPTAFLSSAGSVSGPSSWNPWLFGIPPMLYVLPSPHGGTNPGDATNIVPIPWYGFYGTPSFAATHPSGFPLQPYPVDVWADESSDKAFSKGGSQTSSNLTSVGEASIVGKSCEDGEQSGLRENSTNLDFDPSPMQSKGFVPYKRPLGEDGVKQSDDNQNSENCQVQLCL